MCLTENNELTILKVWKQLYEQQKDIIKQGNEVLAPLNEFLGHRSHAPGVEIDKECKNSKIPIAILEGYITTACRFKLQRRCKDQFILQKNVHQVLSGD